MSTPPPPDAPGPGRAAGRSLVAIVTVLANKVARLETRSPISPRRPRANPPRLLIYPRHGCGSTRPPPATPHQRLRARTPRPDPRGTVENFVDWYNQVFLGRDGGRAKPIPPCWRAHPGLAMEVAALAYGWRAANLGKSATVQQSLYWLHYWRPGFADRLGHDWLHPSCLDGEHLPVGASPRLDRFTGAATDASPQ